MKARTCVVSLLAATAGIGRAGWQSESLPVFNMGPTSETGSRAIQSAIAIIMEQKEWLFKR